MTSSAAGKKQYIIYNEYWPYLVKEQQKQKLGKVEWMHKSGLFHGRYSEFDNKYRGREGKDITAYYFLRLLGGLGKEWEVFVKQVEQATGKKMTEAQRKELGYGTWLDTFEDNLKLLHDDPELFRDVMRMIKRRQK